MGEGLLQGCTFFPVLCYFSPVWTCCSFYFILPPYNGPASGSFTLWATPKCRYFGPSLAPLGRLSIFMAGRARAAAAGVHQRPLSFVVRRRFRDFFIRPEPARALPASEPLHEYGVE
ncbi:hypothetical protein EVAR_79775_1 [Eumeta japonica]|uniref:Uncharacterized protein n=1 Tax=Eumeta variegata TaxID=151549 RepID=A0A4C1TC05_EUMVA|nr:hypothetical protein EVAR_79775_1 [Eumeta japonica]